MRTSIEWAAGCAELIDGTVTQGLSPGVRDNHFMLHRAVDPLLKMTTSELAYLAGLLDGEGCFRISHVGPKRITYYPTVEIAMTDLGTIEWVQSKWKSGTVKLNNHTAIRKETAWKKQYIVRIHGKRAHLLCTLLLPFLITKHQQATLITEFPIQDCRFGKRGIPVEVHVKRNAAFLKMRALNRRGPMEQSDAIIN